MAKKGVDTNEEYWTANSQRGYLTFRNVVVLGNVKSKKK